MTISYHNFMIHVPGQIERPSSLIVGLRQYLFLRICFEQVRQTKLPRLSRNKVRERFAHFEHG